jgi:26S proteasome regulatory subunit T4
MIDVCPRDLLAVEVTADSLVIVKASSGPRYVVSYRPTLPVHKVCLTTPHIKTGADEQLKAGVRVSLDMTTLTIMRILPREVDPMVCSPYLPFPSVGY